MPEAVLAAHIPLTQSVWIGTDAQAPECLAEQLSAVTNRAGETVPQSGAAQGSKEVTKAMTKVARAVSKESAVALRSMHAT